MPIARLAEASIHYTVRGSGEPLVLIPGFAAGQWGWRFQLEKLAEHFRVIALDPRGIGKSTLARQASAAISDNASDVVGVLDACSIRRAHILGISFGGFVAQEVALGFPSRIRRLILACTSSGGPGHVPAHPEVLRGFFQPLDGRESARNDFVGSFTPEFATGHSEVVEELWRERIANAPRSAVVVDQLRSALAFDVSERLNALEAETLILTGTNDKVVPAENSVKLATMVKHSRLHLIKGAGHMFFVEQAQEFNASVIEFLS